MEDEPNVNVGDSQPNNAKSAVILTFIVFSDGNTLDPTPEPSGFSPAMNGKATLSASTRIMTRGFDPGTFPPRPDLRIS